MQDDMKRGSARSTPTLSLACMIFGKFKFPVLACVRRIRCKVELEGLTKRHGPPPPPPEVKHTSGTRNLQLQISEAKHYRGLGLREGPSNQPHKPFSSYHHDLSYSLRGHYIRDYHRGR